MTFSQYAAADTHSKLIAADRCPINTIDLPVELRIAAHRSANMLPIDLKADIVELENDSHFILTGNAQITNGRRGIYANRIEYSQSTSTAVAEDNVRFYSTHGDLIKADHLEVQTDSFSGQAKNIEIKIANRDIEQHIGDSDANHTPIKIATRAWAQHLMFNDSTLQRLTKVTLTTCAEGHEDVFLSADKIELDHNLGFGTAKSLTVRFKKIPIFYFPMVTFPLNDERKTGFLFPSIGYQDESGWIVQTPYYINLAPNYDATLTPRILSKRGGQISTQFRYIGANSRGNLQGEFLPSDQQFDGEDRYSFGYQHDYSSRNWNVGLDWETLSDSDYLRDFSTEIDVFSSNYVDRKAWLDYFGETFTVGAQAVSYESVNNNVLKFDRPYKTLPQFTLQFHPRNLNFMEYGSTFQYTRFVHSDGERIEGDRLHFQPHIGAVFDNSYGYLHSRLSQQIIHYSLEEPITAGGDDSPSLSLPIFSIDGGLFFDRSFPRVHSKYTQTIEPRLFYVKVPRKNRQNDFPVFDANNGSEGSFAHLFRENRFFGGDRVGDTEQLSLGLSTRIIRTDTGKQHFQFSLGQAYYLKNRTVGLSPDSSTDTRENSGPFIEFASSFAKRWKMNGFARWDDNQDQLETFRLFTRYHYDARQHATLAYIFAQDLLELANETKNETKQVNASLHTQLGARQQLMTDIAYSLQENELKSMGLSVRFDGCCWAVKFSMERHLEALETYKNSFKVTLRLSPFGRIKSI